MELVQMAWSYYTFWRDTNVIGETTGYLIDEDGDRAFDKRFDSVEAAEEWLVEQDIRGTVK